jgi:hypothetical protein
MSKTCPTVNVLSLTVATIVFRFGSCALACHESIIASIVPIIIECCGNIFSSSGARGNIGAVDTVIQAPYIALVDLRGLASLEIALKNS